MPASWRAVPWKAKGGYGSQGNGRGRANAGREVLWLSPHCERAEDDYPLFADEDVDVPGVGWGLCGG